MKKNNLQSALGELLKKAGKDNLISISGDKITYVLQRKTYVWTDPEEKVRAHTYLKLVYDYDYPPANIDFEVKAPRREPKLPADIVVYEEPEKDTTFIVVETKEEATTGKIDEATRAGLGNSNLLNAQYLLTVCGEEWAAYSVDKKPSLKSLGKYRIADIPKKYGKEPKYRYRKGAGEFFDIRRVNFNVLRSKFQRCHDEIWEGGKRDPAESFDEMSKVMFAKIYDERFTKTAQYYKFQRGTNETPSEVARRVRDLYAQAQSKEPGIFTGDIGISDKVISSIVELIQDVNLSATDLDAKGRAFEHFLGEVFRGKLGQYFTRREIVEFMVAMLDLTVHDVVIDPACGSGGFLLYCIKDVREKIRLDYGGDERTIARLDWDFSHKQVFGIEINDRIARVAMMDMVLHDDGHSNIECHDALDDYKYFDKRKDIREGRYSLLLTNPPFGAVVKDHTILKSFDLGSKNQKRKAQKTEILFIERCLSLLKAKGRMAIVVPDGILTNSSLKYVREFIRSKAKILGVVSLPDHAFVPSDSGVKASLLFLEKRGPKDKDLGDTEIIMAMVDHIGYDATGRLDANDFPEVLNGYKEFRERRKRNERAKPNTFIIKASELEDRFDPAYYQPKYKELLSELARSRYKVVELGTLITGISGGATPTAKSDAYVEKGGIPFLRIQNIGEGYIGLSEVKYITRKVHEKKLKRSMLRPNEILMTITGRVGTSAVVPEGFGEGNINQHIARMELKEGVNPYYIEAVLNSHIGRLQVERKVTGTTRIALDYPAIRSIKIPLPPKDVQDKIAEQVAGEREKAKELLAKGRELLASVSTYAAREALESGRTKSEDG